MNKTDELIENFSDFEFMIFIHRLKNPNDLSELGTSPTAFFESSNLGLGTSPFKIEIFKSWDEES